MCNGEGGETQCLQPPRGRETYNDLEIIKLLEAYEISLIESSPFLMTLFHLFSNYV